MWYEELGFDENPFEINSFKTDFNLIKRDKESKEILYRISAGSMLVIEGKEGTGKTALLRYAIDNFKGAGKVIYLDGNKISRRLNVENLLIKKSGIIKGRLMKKKPKGMILLFDNVQKLNKKNCERIKYFYDQDYLKSIVFTTDSYSKVNFSDSIRDRIGSNIIRLSNLKEEDIHKIVKERLEGKELFSDEIVKQLYNESNKNIKQFLLNAPLLAEYLVENNKKKLTKTELKNLLKKEVKKEEEEGKTELCDHCKSPLLKIGDNWRCENCDTYCTTCGALVDEDDLECPNCEVSFKTEGDKK